MVDRWRRPEFNDFASITYGLKNIQQIGQNSKTFQQQQDDRKENKLLKRDANYNASLFNPGAVKLDEGSPYASEEEAREAAMRGNLDARLLGTQMAVGQAKAEGLLRAETEAADYNKKLGQITDFFIKNPKATINDIPNEYRTGAAGNKAVTTISTQRAQSAEGQERFQAATWNIVEKSWPRVHAMQLRTQEALQNGDLDTAAVGLKAMAKELKIPYEIGDFDKKTQTFERRYKGASSGEYKAVGRVSLQELMSLSNKLTKEKYYGVVAMNRLAINKQNQEYRNEKLLYGRNANGDRFALVRQQSLDDPDATAVEVQNLKTKDIMYLPSMKAVNGLGITVENLKREKDLKDLEVKDAAIDSHNLANRGKYKERTLYHKDGSSVKVRNLFEEKAKRKEGFSDVKPGGPSNYTKTKDQMAYEQKAVKNYLDANLNAPEEEVNKIRAMAGTEFQAEIDGWTKVSNPKTGERGYRTPDGVVDIYGRLVKKASSPESSPDSNIKKVVFNPDKKNPSSSGRIKTAGVGGPGGNSKKSFTPLPSITKNSGFQSSMDKLLNNSGATATPKIKQALQITKGNFNPEDKTVTFTPSSEKELRQTLKALNEAGVFFDAKEGPDGQIIVNIIEGKPNMVKG